MRRPSVNGAAEPKGPLDRLMHLQKHAIVGYDALCEATSVAPVYRWDGIFTDDHHMEVSGPSVSGKTTFVFLLIAALANPTGSPVSILGRDVCPIEDNQYVIVLEEENATYSVRAKLEDSCAMLGLPVRETIDRCIFIVRKGMGIHFEDEGRLGRSHERAGTISSRGAS